MLCEEWTGGRWGAGKGQSEFELQNPNLERLSRLLIKLQLSQYNSFCKTSPLFVKENMFLLKKLKH